MAATENETTSGYDATVVDDRAVKEASAARVRRLVLLADGLFLAVSGATTGMFELLGYYTGAGPLGAVFDDSPYTIGWVENHGFALLVGVLFLLVARVDGRRFWHGFAVAVHVLLGAANLLFWNSFVTFGTVPLGVAATFAHALFIVAQFWCLRSARQSVR